jgi:hypothetical protein
MGERSGGWIILVRSVRAMDPLEAVSSSMLPSTHGVPV